MAEVIGIVVFILFALSLLIQIGYYVGIFSKLAFYRQLKQDAAALQKPVSIVICAKNEAQNLQKNIPLIFRQEYPEFQVVVVNDCSYDESEEILKEFQKKYSNLHVVTLKEDEINPHDKKLALTLGIKGAKHELLLLTDADCVPRDVNWISSMVRNFKPGTDIVLGYGGYKRRKGILNRLIRFDTFFIAVQYLSYSLKGKPYMGIGRNMAYRKSLFFENKGFATHYHIRSGDDDIFINRVATNTNTAVEVSTASHTLSEPKRTLKGWFNQKRRHITTGKYYKFNHKLLLGIFSASQYLFFITFILLLLFKFQLYIVLSAFLFRLLIQFFIFKKSMDKLGEKDLLIFTPFYEIILMLFYPTLVIGNIFIKENKWK